MEEFIFKSDSAFKLEFREDMLRLYTHSILNKDKLTGQSIDVSFGCIKAIELREFGVEYQYQVVQLTITGISFGNIIQISCLKSNKEEYSNLLLIKDRLMKALEKDFDADFTKRNVGNGVGFNVIINNLEKKGKLSEESEDITLREHLIELTEHGKEISKDMMTFSDSISEFGKMLIYLGSALMELGIVIIFFSFLF